MENGSKQWRFKARKDLTSASDITVRGMLNKLHGAIVATDTRPTVFLGHGDPSAFPCFRVTPTAVDAIVDSLRSAKFNGYAPTVGVLPARRAIAEYLSGNLPYKLSPDDVNLTSGCSQAIEVVLSVLSQPGANILLPRPGFPAYESRAAFSKLEFRHFDLLPEKGWEIDLDAVEALADDNTVAMVIINPGNPCGNVYSYQHLQKVAETARRLGIMVIADEVYERIAFGTNPFVPMGTFGSIAPVITLGSISKRWVVPGWRLGWLVITDPSGVLKQNKIVDSIHGCLNICSDPATFIQGAIPKVIEDTKEDFFKNTINILRQASGICYERIKEIDCLTCPHKPEGSMFVMVKLNLSLLEDIVDDFDFCFKLVKEENVVVLPGITVGLKNWLRVTFAIEPASLEDGLGRVKSFCVRHAKETVKNQNQNHNQE
ncbi:probable aminotransferase TAT2 [Macadamia integrifolia]|uniref:probable aminotransferase TAT2 n=1 Tax=Macadamia integrifolia TaxID=60698 RepID=UPI001C4E7566|nr:probable aminotransferase TAT2 [Macadamia integrifolia]